MQLSGVQVRPERKMRTGTLCDWAAGGRKRLTAMGVLVVVEAWLSLRRVPLKVLMEELVVKVILAVGVVVRRRVDGGMGYWLRWKGAEVEMEVGMVGLHAESFWKVGEK